MKRRQLLFSSMIILIVGWWQVPVQAQDIPVNYTQNPNMEHDLNPIFWYGGWDAQWGRNGVAARPWLYVTETESHSGNQSMWFRYQWHYIWVSYPCRGQEQKKMKASFWYKGKLQSYWNFIYRDLGMSEEDLHPSLAEYVGADTAWHHLGGQDALRFDFGGPSDETPDWTYFEFVWDMPGTIKGWGNTAMWYSDVPEAFVDDLYYGEWYDGQYSGEEEFGIVDGDFEKSQLDPSYWLVNIWYNDKYFNYDDFLSWTENHSELGMQSLRLMDYWEVYPDTISEEPPHEPDSVLWDPVFRDKNITYYMPALGAEGKNMELSFWHKGNAATLALEFYDDYGLTPTEFPLPAGAVLYADTAHPIYEIAPVDSTMHVAADTFTVADLGDYTLIHDMMIDTLMFADEDTLGFQDFEDAENLALPGPGAWLWLDATGNWNKWDEAVTEDESWSGSTSLELPGDPGWGGGAGYIEVMDDTNFIWEFYYKGNVIAYIALGDTNVLGVRPYDLVNDPEGIVPDDATADEEGITWELSSDYWTRFRFEYSQGSWLADSGIASPDTIECWVAGSYVEGDVGYVDDFLFALGSKSMMVDTNWVVIEADTTWTYELDTVGTTYNLMGAMWDLPAAADWTQWKLNWTNPSTDIGGTLTMKLDNDTTAAAEWITLDNMTFSDDHANWTFFDDFSYGMVSSVRSIMVNDLHVYPNPAVDVLYLSLQIPLRKVEMYNVMGQRVKVLQNPDRKFSVSDLASGMYLLHATDEEGVVHEVKFIKK